MKYLTRGFGAVKLTRTSGLKVLPTPDLGGPSSMFHDEGASTEVTGILVSCMAWMMAGNGSRTSPEKLKPKRISVCARLEPMWEPTKDGIDDVVGRSESSWKVFGKGDAEVL